MINCLLDISNLFFILHYLREVTVYDRHFIMVISKHLFGYPYYMNCILLSRLLYLQQLWSYDPLLLHTHIQNLAPGPGWFQTLNITEQGQINVINYY